MVSSQFHYTKRNRFMPFLLAEILNFQGSTHHIGVGSFSKIILPRIRSLCKKDSRSFDPAVPNESNLLSYIFCISYLFASSSVISSQVTPFSAINTIIWYRKSEISYFTSSGSGFLAAITISVASSPTFFKILSIPLSKR